MTPPQQNDTQQQSSQEQGDLVVILSQVFPPDPTAVGQHMHGVASELTRRGHRVRVYTANRGYENPTEHFPSRETVEGADVRRLPLSSFGKSSIAIRLLGGISFTLQCLLRVLFTPNVTHLLVSTSPPMCSFAAVVVSWFRPKIRITFWAMDLNPDQMVAMGKLRENSLPVKLFDTLNRAILKRARTVVALDRFMADRLNAKLEVGEKMIVLPPWPEVPTEEPLAHKDNPFRKTHGLEGKRVIMYSGNLSPASPVTTILEAARRVEDLERLVFLFIGGGLGKQEVDELIERENPPNIRSLPYQPVSQLRYSLSAADVHLVSVGENIVGICHPCKVYGAMSVHRPILLLGPAECHVTDIIAGHNVGWSVDYGEVNLAEQILREIAALTDEQLNERGNRAGEMVCEQFTKSQVCGEFCDILIRGPDAAAPSRRLAKN